MSFRNMMLQRSGRTLPSRRAEVSPFDLLQSDVSRLFDRFFNDSWLMPRSNGDAGQFMPRVDVVDEKTHFRVTAELPGMDPKDVELTVEDNALVLKGEKKHESTHSGNGNGESSWYQTERSYGAFQRVIGLPEEIDADNPEAVFENGVLSVRLRKQSPREQKKIPIQVK